MNYCINPQCQNRQNYYKLDFCQACGTPLLIKNRYRIIQPLRKPDLRYSTDIFEVEDGEKCKVMKVLKYNNSDLIEFFEREAFTLQELNHPGIPKVEIDGYFSIQLENNSQKLYCLVMEKIEGDTLEEWLSKNGKISQKIALNWLRQLINILGILHENFVFHRDIKPSNIILKPDGNLVLIDFGSIRNITDTYLAKLKGGINITSIISGGYTPQEQIDGKALPQSDFFALGRTMVHLMTAIPPVELPINVKTGLLIWRNKAPQISQPLADFIDELMSPIASQRPQNTTSILHYLTASGLRLKSIQRFFSSPQFKLACLGLFTAACVYRLSFPWIADYYYNKGVQAQKISHLEKAQHLYETALYFNPNESKIYNNLALLCDTLKKDVSCVEENYQKSLKLDPYNYVTRYNLGGFYDDTGDLDKAAKEYEIAAQSNSRVSINATSDLARLRILDGDAETAIKLSLQALQKSGITNNQKASLYKNLGWAFFMDTKYKQAEANLRKSISFNQKRTDAYCLLAQVLEVQGKNQEALKNWQHCLDGNSKNRLEIKIWQTLAKQRLKEAGKTP